MIVLWPRDVIVVPIAFVFFFLALITMIPPSAVGLDQGRGKRRKLSRKWTIVLNVCLGMAMASALLAVAAVPLTEVAVLVIMPRLHYLSCPPPPRYERHPPQRWALSYDHCPL